MSAESPPIDHSCKLEGRCPNAAPLARIDTPLNLEPLLEAAFTEELRRFEEGIGDAEGADIAGGLDEFINFSDLSDLTELSDSGSDGQMAKKSTKACDLYRPTTATVDPGWHKVCKEAANERGGKKAQEETAG